MTQPPPAQSAPAQPEPTPAAAGLPDGSAYVLHIDCPERPGLAHLVTGFLQDWHADILELKQFDDFRAGRFFLRVHFVLDRQHEDPGAEGLRAAFAPLAEQCDGTFDIRAASARRRVLIMVSKFPHALNDLLFRARNDELGAEIVAVVSNHPDAQQLVEWHKIPFFHVPITRDTKPAAEARLLELVEQFDVELVVLARYMQIFSDELSRTLSGRAINIHHSFLPSFKGAKPYHQAYDRGVKTVGATAHYVSSDLDEGPIIAQSVQEVDHSFGPEELVAAGRDTECKALSNAVRWHCEDRVFLHGHRTVILR
ncbi:formyltetrahydrofolate deformylase [Ornithinimicrobium faecis]|uniref:Formyltetrahydrofolate deformylase n=1 Tax=Ornithinimicrobium faecis TaxID=2934158 RepID=A0ABY4YU56_9MICO|nr:MULTISPECIES: formyltetrahydrofolate deformylase [unclassified Ornithinimicrobium]USQ80010.1 formyltetrahydrofolate deformylase [Ornithinimicrobium sp. HY1793]